MRILITGTDGQLGWELLRALQGAGQLVAAPRGVMDLADERSIRTCLRSQRPDLVLNAAAYTAVDRAQTETQAAMAANGVAPGVIAEEMGMLGGVLIHYSTDYVFDGTKASAWTEDDPTGPLNVYGETKLAGERAALGTGAQVLVLRTSWVYGNRGRNFLTTIRRLSAEREELRIVEDQMGAPTWCRSIAAATALLVGRAVQGIRGGAGARLAGGAGVCHLSAAGSTSWAGFARAIVEGQAGPRPRIVGIPAAEYVAPAPRPANSVLSNDRLEARFGVRLPDWSEGLRLCLEEAAVRSGVPAS